MISYTLGKAGEGKTYFCLQRLSVSENGVYFGSIPQDYYLEYPALQNIVTIQLDGDLSEKCFVDFGNFYRKYLDDREVFVKAMIQKIENAIGKSISSIYLDEFQLYCCDEIIKLIKEHPEIEFYIIHQYPEQIDEHNFNDLWNQAERKYTFNPLSVLDHSYNQKI